MSVQYGQIQGVTYVACHLEPTAAEFGEPTHTENEAKLVRRKISDECDRFHHGEEDAGCENPSCMCWCHG